MNCPYCNKDINGLTGLIELKKFQKHLRTCKKHPDRIEIKTPDGKMVLQPHTSMMDALNIRHDSGQ